MSPRTVLAVVAILGSLAVCPVAAQVERAPMPHEKPCPVVCAEDGCLQIDDLSGTHGDCGFLPAGRPTVHFNPVPMPRAIVEVIGDFELGVPDSWMGCGSCRLRTIFRPAPLVRSAQPMPMREIEPGFTWSSPDPYQGPHALLDVVGPARYSHPRVHPSQIIQARLVPNHRTVHVDGPGGWWLEEGRLPQPKCGASGETAPQDHWEWRDQFPCTLVQKVAPPDGQSLGSTGKLSGTWFRELEGVVIAATFSGDELTLCIKRCEDGQMITFTISADYAVTKDGTVHGVVTGADVKFDRDSKAAGLTMSTVASISDELQATVNCPFAFRIRRTSSGVIMSNLKLAAEAIDKEALSMACGMFKYAADGKLPPPKPTSSGRPCENPTLLSGRYLKHYPQYFAPDPQHPLPRELAPQVDPEGVSWRGGESVPSIMVPASGYSVTPPQIKPPRPANVPAGDFGMMAEVFGQMLGTKAPPLTPPGLVPPPAVSPAPVPTMSIPAPPRIERPR